MKVWVTKYALSQGIYSADVEETSSLGLVVQRQENGSYPMYYHEEGRDWHRTEEAAVIKANKMVTDKIVSLRKQVAKLENTTFTREK